MTRPAAGAVVSPGLWAERQAVAVLAALPDAVVVVDAEDRVRDANPAAEQLLGLSSSQMAGQPLADAVRPDGPLFALVARARESGAAVSEYCVPLSLRRGGVLAADLRMAPIAEVPGAVAILLRERTMADKLGGQIAQQAAGRALATLAMTLAHEIKNPLAGIRGAAQLLEPDQGEGGKNLARLIVGEVDRIRGLVDRLETFADDQPARRHPLNVHEVLEHVRRLAEAGAGPGMRFLQRYDPSLPEVDGNRDLLVQALLNLVKNAVEAVTAAGGTTGEIVLTTAYEAGLRLVPAGGSARVDLPIVVGVQDDGPGIPDAVRAHLFEPFVSGKPGGRGLGLAVVAKAVAAHGGAIEVDSRPGRTLFRVFLPVARARRARP